MTGHISLVAYAVHSVVTGLTIAPVPDCSQSTLATWRPVSIETGHSSGPLPSRIEPLVMICIYWLPTSQLADSDAFILSCQSAFGKEQERFM